MEKNFRLILSALFIFIFIACSTESPDSKIISENNGEKKDTLEFYFEVDREIYLKSDYGEAPQVAVWIEYPDSSFYKTVFVTRRSAKNDWVGKVECPVALPYWNSRKSNEEDPGVWKKLVDAVSGATQVNGKNRKTIVVPSKKNWKYFVEVNASGDYNEHFPYWSANGIPDSEGNGQPSIVYSGIVGPDSNSISVPELIGFTNQHAAVDTLCMEIEKITSARKLLKTITVKKINK